MWMDVLRQGNTRQPGLSDWNKQLEALYELGIGMDAALQFLFAKQPSLDEFKSWIDQNTRTLAPVSDLEEDVLTAEDLCFFEEKGYVVLRAAVSQTSAAAAKAAIRDFLGIDENDPATWYTQHPQKKGLMLNLTDHPALAVNRSSSRIKKAFEQLYESKNLLCNIGITSFNPPVIPEYNFMGEGLHWDVSLKQPITFLLQGLLYLSDCAALEGAFHCVPGFHKKVGEWLQTLSPQENPRELVKQFEAVPVTGQAGDLIIWQQALPHCATPNKGTRPRYVQYVSYRPKGYVETREWI